MIKQCATCQSYSPWAEYKDVCIGYCGQTRLVHKDHDVCDDWGEKGATTEVEGHA